jgi:phosphoribosylformylglycinamidine (FGAM) synthase-like enzyme
VSGGGLAVALAEMCIWGDRGAQLRLGVGDSPAVALFGESPSRLVVEVLPRHAAALELLARQHGLPAEGLGSTGGARLVIELVGEGATGAAEDRGSGIADALDESVADLRHAWEQGLPRALGWELAG